MALIERLLARRRGVLGCVAHDDIGMRIELSDRVKRSKRKQWIE